MDALLVSIHALLAECDWGSPSSIYSGCRFQSTHSLRSATCSRGNGISGSGFQSTHSLRSATFRGGLQPAFPRVSIHALLAECDND